MRRTIDFVLTCAVAVALTCFSAAGHADEARCKPLPQMLSEAQEHPIYESHVVLDAEQTLAANVLIRRVQGAPETDWNLVVLMNLQDGSGLVLAGNDGAICGGFGVPKEVWYAFVTRLIGSPA